LYFNKQNGFGGGGGNYGMSAPASFNFVCFFLIIRGEILEKYF